MLRVVFPLLLLPTAAFASPGAWLQPEGQGQLIVNTLAYRSSERFNENASRQNASRYTKVEVNPYAEYGLTDNITIGGSTFLQHVDTSSGSNYGVGETELFARTPVWTEEDYIVSIQPMVKLPGIRADDSPALGSRHPDVGISLISGTNFLLFDVPMFAESDTGVRYRFGEPKNQYRANVSVGAHVHPDVMVLAQSFATWRSVKGAFASFTQSTADDYDLVKTQLSTVYQYSPDLAFQAGIFADVYGKNTGAGQGALIAVWSTF